MHIHTLLPTELDDAARQQWAATAALRRVSPFCTPQWAELCGRHRPTTRVIVIDAGSTTAFLAVDVDRGVLRPAGLSLNDVQSISGDVISVSARRLARAAGARQLSLPRMVDVERLDGGTRRQRPCPVVDLHQGYAAYLEDLRARGSGLAARIRSCRRKMAAQLGDVRIETNVLDPRVLPTLLDWKSAQLRRTGFDDIFAKPWVRSLLDEVSGLREEGLSGWTTALYAGDELLAAHVGLLGHGVAQWWVTGYDPQHAPLQPGLVLTVACIEWLGEQRVDLLDLGVGEEQYKLRLANRTDVRWQVDWQRPNPATATIQLARRAARRAASPLRPR